MVGDLHGDGRAEAGQVQRAIGINGRRPHIEQGRDAQTPRKVSH